MLRAEISHRLLRSGTLLFLLGLITGLGMPLYANPRMGLTSHLEGILNGIFLMLLGLAWDRLALGDRLQRVGSTVVIYGTWANWAVTLLAAVWGAGAAMPIAGQGQVGTPVQEILIGVGLGTLSVAMLFVSGVILWGLRRRTRAAAPAGARA